MESTPLVKDEDTLGGEGECLERSVSLCCIDMCRQQM